LEAGKGTYLQAEGVPYMLPLYSSSLEAECFLVFEIPEGEVPLFLHWILLEVPCPIS
jgi:hypothetical protein